MPDGFDPHVELQRIYNLRDLMVACRERVPKTLEILDEILHADSEVVSYDMKLKVIDMMWNRGYGKARQSVTVTDETSVKTQRLVILPDNNRDDLPPITIDGESNG
jgi:hypothetical protein